MAAARAGMAVMSEQMLCAVPVAALWSTPTTTSDDDRLTEILLGEPVRVLDREGDRAYVVAPWQPSSRDLHGYPGWVDASALVAGEVPDRPVAVVTGPTAEIAVEGDEPIVASFGTLLPMVDESDESDEADQDGEAGESGRVRVLLPGGREGVVDAAAVRLPGAPVPQNPLDALDLGRQFLGLEYVWGGLSDRGLDCSGLVHLVQRSLRRTVPRDAFDQAEEVSGVLVADVQPGDLLFFGRPGKRIHHVGFATGVDDEGRLTMLHASERDRYLMEGPLDEDRLATLVGAARPSA